MKKVFTLSDGAREEYCCTICRVGKVTPIPDSDFLAQTVVSGFNIVVRKDEIHEGDVVLYAKNETILNREFLSANNAFEIGEYHLNSNAKEVSELLSAGKDDEAKKKVGFFNKHGRVKMIKLRGCPSMGYIFTLESLAKWDETLASVNLEDYIGKTADGVEIPYNFDTINGKLFVQVYMPPVKEKSVPRGDKRLDKRNKRLKKFDRVIPGTFSFHYDTKQMNDNIWRFDPNSSVCVSVKLHGTSAIFANIPVKKPIPLHPAKVWWNKNIAKKINKLEKQYYRVHKLMAKGYFRKRAEIKKEIKYLTNKMFGGYKIEYGSVYSSRSVIKNQFINRGVTQGFYKVDVWGYINDYIKDYIDKDMVVYGEIVGYVPGSTSMVQKGYDYGCNVGECKFMPYRIVTIKDDKKVEWEVEDILKWTLKLVDKHKDLAKVIMPITILYNGKLSDRYKDVSISEHWNENVLERMKNDFGLEENEPLCVNKKPREGVCIRINGDSMAECFKLKGKAFLFKDGKKVDNGEIDMEMAEAY